MLSPCWCICLQKNILREYLSWPESNLEKLEGLEQLRFLSENKKVKCVEVSSRGNVFWELNNPKMFRELRKLFPKCLIVMF